MQSSQEACSLLQSEVKSVRRQLSDTEECLKTAEIRLREHVHDTLAESAQTWQVCTNLKQFKSRGFVDFCDVYSVMVALGLHVSSDG